LVDLSETIRIDSNFEISYGRLLITILVTLFEVLGILSYNNWVIHPSIFFLISNTFLTLTKKDVEEEIEDLETNIKYNRELIKNQEILIKKLKERLGGKYND